MALFKNKEKEGPEKTDISKYPKISNDVVFKVKEELNTIMGMSALVTKGLSRGDNPTILLEYMQLLDEATENLNALVNNAMNDFKVGKDTDGDNPVVIEGKRILLAVGDKESAEKIVKLFEDQGAQVHLCNNGREAADAFTASIAGAYDAVFMDDVMPVMDGYEATDIIRRSMHPQSKSIPIIGMTKEKSSEHVGYAYKMGMNACLVRPLDKNKIIVGLKTAGKK